jgi:hypothetical protein
MEIRIKEKLTGVIYSSLWSEKDHSILSINFSDESTDFEVQDRIVDNEGKIFFKKKNLAIYDKSNLKNCIIFAIRQENEAEWVREETKKEGE